MNSEYFEKVTKEQKMNTKHRGKWLLDGDCLICTHCGKAIDYHLKVGPGGGYIVPKACPRCLDEKTKLVIE